MGKNDSDYFNVKGDFNIKVNDELFECDWWITFKVLKEFRRNSSTMELTATMPWGILSCKYNIKKALVYTKPFMLV